MFLLKKDFVISIFCAINRMTKMKQP